MVEVNSAGPDQAELSTGTGDTVGLAEAEVHDVLPSAKVKVKSQLGSAFARTAAAKRGMAKKDFIFDICGDREDFSERVNIGW